MKSEQIFLKDKQSSTPDIVGVLLYMSYAFLSIALIVGRSRDHHL